MMARVRFDDAVIPLQAAWSSPFVRWQGPAAGINSLDLAEQVTRRALERTKAEWRFDELVLGWTVPQKDGFYGAPTLAARLGLGVGGPMIHQACATGVATLHHAAAGLDGANAKLVVTTDRTSNGPHLVWPGAGPGGTVESENLVVDGFDRDPTTNGSMLSTAERVAAQAGFRKEELDELTAHRYSQYEDGLADDRAFQRRFIVPITAGSRREPL